MRDTLETFYNIVLFWSDLEVGHDYCLFRQKYYFGY